MNDIDLIRKLVREFVLLEENQMDLQRSYENWRSKFLKIVNQDISINKYDNKTFREKLLSIPESLKDYDLWKKNNYKPASRWDHLKEELKIANLLLMKFNLQQQPQQPQKLDNKGLYDLSLVWTKKASSFGLSKEEIRKEVDSGKNGEFLIIKILNKIAENKNIKQVATKTKGDYGLWDVNFNGKRYEVKDITTGDFRSGKTGKDNTQKFLSSFLPAVKELEDFYSFSIENQIINPELNSLFEKLQNTSKQEVFSLISKGEITQERLDTLVSIIETIRNQKKIIEKKMNLSIFFVEKGQKIDFKEEEEQHYYSIVDYIIKNLKIPKTQLLSQEEMKNFHYLRLTNGVFFSDEKMFHLLFLLKNPNLSFNETIEGIFLIDEINSNDPTITYISRSRLNQFLIFSRITEGSSKFNLKGKEKK